MLSVNGIYDGEKISLFEKIKIGSPRRVIVTFLDETLNEENIIKEIYINAEKSAAFEFLKEPEEDIYSDKDLKVSYKK